MAKKPNKSEEEIEAEQKKERERRRREGVNFPLGETEETRGTGPRIRDRDKSHGEE
jgi:hypothetical protein